MLELKRLINKIISLCWEILRDFSFAGLRNVVETDDESEGTGFWKTNATFICGFQTYFSELRILWRSWQRYIFPTNYNVHIFTRNVSRCVDMVVDFFKFRYWGAEWLGIFCSAPSVFDLRNGHFWRRG